MRLHPVEDASPAEGVRLIVGVDDLAVLYAMRRTGQAGRGGTRACCGRGVRRGFAEEEKRVYGDTVPATTRTTRILVEAAGASCRPDNSLYQLFLGRRWSSRRARTAAQLEEEVGCPGGRRPLSQDPPLAGGFLVAPGPCAWRLQPGEGDARGGVVGSWSLLAVFYALAPGFRSSTPVGKLLMRQAADTGSLKGVARAGASINDGRPPSTTRTRRRGRGRRLQVPQQRPDVRVRQPHLRAGPDLRRLWGRRRPRRRATVRSAPASRSAVRAPTPRVAAHQRGGGGQGGAPRRRRGGRMLAGRRKAAPDRPPGASRLARRRERASWLARRRSCAAFPERGRSGRSRRGA